MRVCEATGLQMHVLGCKWGDEVCGKQGTIIGKSGVGCVVVRLSVCGCVRVVDGAK